MSQPLQYQDEHEQRDAALQLQRTSTMTACGGQDSSHYKQVKALVISWDEDSDDLNSKAEVDGFSQVLMEQFNYKVVPALLKQESEHLPQVQIMHHVSEFVWREDGPNTLLIVYYAGHGMPETSTGRFKLAGKRGFNETLEESNEVIWNLVEDNLQKTRADVLEIFDCCYAGYLGRSQTYENRSMGFSPRSFEFLGATSSDSSTRCPGEKSFTTALIWALKELAMEKGRFTVSELSRKITSAPKFPRDQIPVLFERSESSLERIILAPLQSAENVPDIKLEPETDAAQQRADQENAAVDELDSEDELESLYSENIPSLTTGSTTSSNESMNMIGTLANRFARIFLEDNDLKPLCEFALQRMPYDKFDRNIRRLLQTYAVDLRQEAKQPVERLAAKAIKRHLDKVLVSLRTKLDPSEATKAARMDSLSKQKADKVNIMQSYLSESQYNETYLQSKIENRYEEELSSDDSNDDTALSQSFNVIKPFLSNGVAFESLKRNLQNFLYPSSKPLTSITQEVAPGLAAIEKTDVQHIKLDTGIESLEGFSTSQHSRPGEERQCTEQDQSLNIPAESLVCVEDYGVVRSFSDHCKIFVERFLGQALLWWPLKEPLRPLGDGMRRLSWTCECRSKISFDVPSQPGIFDTMSLPNSVTPTVHTGSVHSLPRHDQPSINLGLSSSSYPGPSRAQPAPPENRNQPALPSTYSGLGTQFSTTFLGGQYIYWCIDTERTSAELIEISVCRLTDQDFGQRLLSEYAMVKGWWHQFWTMTSCQGVSFKKFLYLHDDLNLVHYKAELAGLPGDPPYQYKKPILPLDSVTHVSLLESKVNHMLNKHISVRWPWSSPVACCTNSASTDLLQQIPKLVPNGLVPKEDNEGYGMQAVARLALWRIIAMLLIWQSGSVLFLIYWLTRHPSDLQNGFMVLATTMMGFGLYLEILLRFSR